MLLLGLREDSDCFRRVQDSLWDESSAFPREKSHPLNFPVSVLPHFSPLLLWLYHQREKAHISGEKKMGERRLCFVNNALIIIYTCS